MNIEKLPKEFKGTGEVQGFQFKQLAEHEIAYLYKVSDETSKHYEIVKKRIVPKCLDFEKKIYSENEFKETYPKAEHFGKDAWCANTLEKAFEIFENIEEEE